MKVFDEVEFEKLLGVRDYSLYSEWQNVAYLPSLLLVFFLTDKTIKLLFLASEILFGVLTVFDRQARILRSSKFAVAEMIVFAAGFLVALAP